MGAVAGVPARKLLQADGEVGAGHAIAAVLEDQVGGGDLELLRRQLQSLANDLVRADRCAPPG